MLRITRQLIGPSTDRLRLEGKLLEPWIEEMQRSVNDSQDSIQLDLSALTYADAAGIEALAELIRDGAVLTACSGYIAALLHVGKP